MSIKDNIKKKLKNHVLESTIKGTNRSIPAFVYEVPKPDNYDELIKRVKENHPELNLPYFILKANDLFFALEK